VPYKHWRNWGEPGELVMATTTVLDFVPVFKDPARAELMTDLIFRCSGFYGSQLHAFVMPEHIHLLLRLPLDMNASTFFNRFKGYSASVLVKTLGWKEKAMFSQQIGLNRRTFWQRSFRSRVIEAPWRFRVAAGYIHKNPVKRGLCSVPEEWRWSSAWMDAAHEWDCERGMRLGCWWESKTASTLERAEA
jgi:REP element-mobilizing transposase RayT